jgi:hypothetical protein
VGDDMVEAARAAGSEVFRTLSGLAIFWRDKQDFVHACEATDVHRDVRLVSTLCNRDVPENEAYLWNGETVTCDECKTLVHLPPRPPSTTPFGQKAAPRSINGPHRAEPPSGHSRRSLKGPLALSSR